jgi:hypothetical protein
VDECRSADESGPPISNTHHLGEHQCRVLFVNAGPGIPGRINSWGSIKGVHDKSGIIGYRGQARFRKGGTSFDQRVSAEGLTVLDGRGSRGRQKSEAWHRWPQNPLEFQDFVGISSANNDVHGLLGLTESLALKGGKLGGSLKR